MDDSLGRGRMDFSYGHVRPQSMCIYMCVYVFRDKMSEEGANCLSPYEPICTCHHHHHHHHHHHPRLEFVNRGRETEAGKEKQRRGKAVSYLFAALASGHLLLSTHNLLSSLLYHSIHPSIHPSSLTSSYPPHRHGVGRARSCC